MLLLPLLAATLAASAAPCPGETVALLPLEPLALSRAEAREAEEAVRRALAATPGICLQPRAQTLARLGGQVPPACEERACARPQLEALGARWLVRGTVLGVGGKQASSLALVGAQGRVASRSVAPADPQLGAEVAALWGARGTAPVVVRKRSPWPTVTLAAGGAALASGVVMGLLAHGSERKVERADLCAQAGADYGTCLERELASGQRKARTANVLLGAGALLTAGGGLWLAWELP
ncbi:hypothetical protein FGE12_07985 [Aggregicoccus sp. 17bor-14]|uniref:hypothetical protein n=1 Tax=Myxococcaceae TaxID=31 RepID=UPI00129C883E|nr:MULTISPECIES: hypothetical protein [Myxococcaceae]MBF5042336.1 hypothetical protein [Simulacricoccus sp. 17bor-14]MRI88109.1 hypothetical protein [Aggregicoccus sp. 17bor-14]